MLKQTNIRVGYSPVYPVASGVAIENEGALLSWVREGDRAVVNLSAGTGSEDVAGIALSRNTPPSQVARIEAGVIPGSTSSYQVVLERTPIAGQIRVVVDGNEAAPFDAGDPGANADEYSIADATVTFNSATEGQSFKISYLYEPTVTEARMFQGDGPTGGLPSTYRSQISVINSGDIYTDQYDITADWSTAVKLYSGADGRITSDAGAGGTLLSGYTLLEAPSASSPFLGISVRP